MKRIVLIFVLLAAANAERFVGNIDWSKVRPIEDFPHYWTRLPKSILMGMPRRPQAGEGRITNGQIAQPHQFPFQVAVLSTFPQGQGLCGGSVLSPNFILTAGHCVHGATGGTVILGAHNIRDNSEENLKIVFKLDDIRKHEGYNPNTIRNDLALIKLSEPVVFNEKIQPSRLPTRTQAEDDFSGSMATVSGWGRFSDSSSSTATELRFVNNPVLTNDVCAQTFGTSLIQKQQICMSGVNGRSSCNGDSGGPLTVEADGKTQLGVVSFGAAAGCAKGYPSVYARTSEFLDWIEKNSDVVILS